MKFSRYLSLFAVLAISLTPSVSLAISGSDLNAVTDDTVFYNPHAACSTGSESLTIDNAAAEKVAKAAKANVGYTLSNQSGSVLANYNDTFENYGASITKSIILVAYMKQLNDTDTAMTAAQQATVTGMIEQSDNADANTVYHKYLTNGGAQVQAVANEAGMGTAFKFDTSDPVYVLGQSQINANSFAKFFAQIDLMLPSSKRSFALNLLANITPNAGLLQAGIPGVVYSKEGWKAEPDTSNPFGKEGAPYVVNQAGQFTSGGTVYGIAVTVGGTTDEAAGETIIDNVVSALLNFGPANGDGGGGDTSDSGVTLSSQVPAPYNAIFTHAATVTNVDPVLLATVFYTEHRGFPDPPPPYGHGPAWQTSNKGAQGPFQFEPDTWATYGRGGNVQDLVDAAAGAGRFLVALGGKEGVPFGDPTNPRAVVPSVVYALAAYNAGPAGDFNNEQTVQYVQIGAAIYKKLSNGGVVTSSSGCPSPSTGNVAAIAEGQVGTHEWTSETDPAPGSCNCGGSINPDGHSVDSYIQIPPNSPEEWCADFVSWVYQKAGTPFSGGAGPDWRIPAAANVATYVKNHGTWIQNGPKANPEPGMIVYFNWDGTQQIGPPGGNDHVGIVDHVTGNTLFTIEGNASDAVINNSYPNFRSDVDIVGFGGLQ